MNNPFRIARVAQTPDIDRPVSQFEAVMFNDRSDLAYPGVAGVIFSLRDVNDLQLTGPRSRRPSLQHGIIGTYPEMDP